MIPKVVDNYIAEIVGDYSESATTITLSVAMPVITSGYLTVFDLDGNFFESIKFTGVSSNDVTGCIRGLSLTTNSDTSIPANAKQLRSGMKVKLSVTQHVVNEIIDVINGDKSFSAIPKNPSTRTISDARHLVDKEYAEAILSGAVGTASKTTSGTNKMTNSASSNPRAMSALVREQDTPDMTLKVQDFKLSVLDKNISYAGGNSAAFINPGLGGDMAINTQPANGETITITVNGTACVFTAVTTIGSTPGNFLIGADKNATRANLASLINNPGTTNANQVAFTGAQLTAIGYLTATDDLSLNVFIRSANSLVTTFSVSETLAGVGNTWTANTTKHRIDLLVYDTAGLSLAIRKGSESASPSSPTPTSGDIVLAQIYCRVGMSHIHDVDDATNGYVITWYYPNIYRTDYLKTSDVGLSANQILAMGSDGKLQVMDGSKLINLPVAPFQQTLVPYNGGDTFSGAAINSSNDGSVLIAMEWGASNIDLMYITRFERDSSGSYVATHITSFENGSNAAITSASAVFVGSYVYIFSVSTGGFYFVRRYAVADLSGVTTITGWSAANAFGVWTDGTYFFNDGTGDNFDKYSISGTVLTYVSSPTFTSSGSPCAVANDGTYIYVRDNSTGANTIRKYSYSGGAAVSTKALVVNTGLPRQGSQQLIMFKTGVLGQAVGYALEHNTAATGGAITISPLATF